MYGKLEIKEDRSGEPVEVGIVVNPDDETIPEILELLAHKGEIFLWQVKKLYSDEAGGTESRLFVAKRGRKIVSTMMLAEYSGIAILGHAFTVPEERRKGISSILMTHLLADFKKRSGRIITLFTDYQSHPYKYYQKHIYFPYRNGNRGRRTANQLCFNEESRNETFLCRFICFCFDGRDKLYSDYIV